VTFVRNVALFFVLFLPASCATGLSGGWLTGPLPTPRIGYELGLFLVGVMPLLLPSILVVPVLHFAARAFARRRSPREARFFATLATPLALLGVHLVVFGTSLWSVPLVVLFLIPGATASPLGSPEADPRSGSAKLWLGGWPETSPQAPKARAARRSRAKLWCLRALPAGGPTNGLDSLSPPGGDP
jgi:hypothetical protein